MIIQCPHCKDFVWIEQLNCRIFRHACYKSDKQVLSGEPIPPHSTQKECEDLLEKGLVYGCAKPFKILEDGTAVICDYI